jgi:hypothetical protein
LIKCSDLVHCLCGRVRRSEGESNIINHQPTKNSTTQSEQDRKSRKRKISTDFVFNTTRESTLSSPLLPQQNTKRLCPPSNDDECVNTNERMETVKNSMKENVPRMSKYELTRGAKETQTRVSQCAHSLDNNDNIHEKISSKLHNAEESDNVGISKQKEQTTESSRSFVHQDSTETINSPPPTITPRISSSRDSDSGSGSDSDSDSNSDSNVDTKPPPVPLRILPPSHHSRKLIKRSGSGRGDNQPSSQLSGPYYNIGESQWINCFNRTHSIVFSLFNFKRGFFV